MSDSRQEDNIRVEIRKLLKKINFDMRKLKDELRAVHSQIEDNASLPITVRTVNEKLKIAAKEAGIDLDELENLNKSDEEDEYESSSDSDTSEQILKSNENINASLQKI